MAEVEFELPFEVIEPRGTHGALLFNSPHSGNVFPEAFLRSSRLPATDLRRSADLYMDELLIGAVARGVPLMRAHFPRSFLDVNREPYELDPAMFDGRVPPFANSRSARVSSGYGTIARLVAESQEIYSGRIPISEALRRIDQYYLPYHAALRRLISGAHRQFSYAVLIDWHSMPSAVFPAYRSLDVVLGDRHGTSCSSALTDFVEHVARGLGLTVGRNQPYAGGFITEHYGNPVSGLHALQIEVNRALYMDEESQTPHSGFAPTAEALMTLTDALIAYDELEPVPLKVAAE